LDLEQLLWLWEWEESSLSPKAEEKALDDENPFLEHENSPGNAGKNWKRGGLGFVMTPHSCFDKEKDTRIPVYGIGVEIDMDIDKGNTEGVAAVARWTAQGESRLETVRAKIDRFKLLHPSRREIPTATLPPLQKKISHTLSLRKRLSSRSPSPTKLKLVRSSSDITGTPRSVSSTSTASSPIHFPIKEHAAAKSLLQTPIRNRHNLPTPVTSTVAFPRSTGIATPSSSRRSALYERVRQRSLSNSPSSVSSTIDVARERFNALNTYAMRRRSLLGRLSNVAEGIWM
jgi:hypothetical protein